MLRSCRTTSVTSNTFRSVTKFASRNTASLTIKKDLKPSNLKLPLRNRAVTLALTPYKPFSISLERYASQVDKIDRKHESELKQEKVVPHPEEVSTTSTVRDIFHEKGVEAEEKDEPMLAGVYSDWKIVKETFALNEVPKEALVVGLAGVLPYLATSLSTAYLAWDINHASLTGEGFLVSGPTAEFVLNIIEPLQIGYGAVIISFVGAIQWGFEWSRYGGTFGYSRYATGIIAPAVAWPTILMPIETALISQFLAFTFLYFADARAVVRGWAPAWYSTYRFVLTFVVGIAIVVSLVGRGQIEDKLHRMPSPRDRFQALKDVQLEEMEKEERYKQQKLMENDESEDDEDETGNEDAE